MVTILCKGKEFFPCRDVSIFEPAIADQADKLAKEFTTPLGIGIMAESKITAISHRAFQGVLESHYSSSQIYRNMQKGRLESLSDLEPEFSKQYEIDFQDKVAMLVSPAFYLFGRWTIIFLGATFLAMFIGATCGCFSRTWTTYSIYGCSPRLFLGCFNGLHQLLVMIPNFVKGGYNRATNLPAGIMGADATPLAQQLEELRNLVYVHMKRDGEFPPPYAAPSAPLEDMFPEELLEETPAPRSIKRFYPDISVRNKFQTFQGLFPEKG